MAVPLELARVAPAPRLRTRIAPSAVEVTRRMGFRMGLSPKEARVAAGESRLQPLLPVGTSTPITERRRGGWTCVESASRVDCDADATWRGRCLGPVSSRAAYGLSGCASQRFE